MLTQIGLLEPILAQFHAEFSLWLLTAMSDFSSPTRGGCEAGANEPVAVSRVVVPRLHRCICPITVTAQRRGPR